MEGKEYKWTLKRTGERPVRFVGKKLSGASTYMPYGDAQNRYTEYALYKTVGGKYILESNYHTAWQGEYDEDSVYIADDPRDLLSHFPGSEIPDAVIELFDEAGIDISEDIE